jgi:hypothetical protein
VALGGDGDDGPGKIDREHLAVRRDQRGQLAGHLPRAAAHVQQPLAGGRGQRLARHAAHPLDLRMRGHPVERGDQHRPHLRRHVLQLGERGSGDVFGQAGLHAGGNLLGFNDFHGAIAHRDDRPPRCSMEAPTRQSARRRPHPPV